MANQNIVDIARNLWQQDSGQEAYYLVTGDKARNGPRLMSRFTLQSMPAIQRHLVYCGHCSRLLPCVAMIDLREAPCLGISAPIRAYIYACNLPECRNTLNEHLNGRWATYHWRKSKLSGVHSNNSWLEIILTDEMNNEQAAKSVSCSELVTIEAGRDVLDPADFGWYPGDGIASHAQQAINNIKDPITRYEVYSELIRQVPRWFNAKFCGYPHWRFVALDAGCECSMRGSLVITFSHELSPALCEPGVSAWLFVCKSNPLEHSASLIFQRSPNSGQLLGSIPAPAMLAL